MTTTYKWIISQIDAAPHKEGHDDVVINVHWRRQATDGTHTADVYGSQAITYDAATQFTPIDSLTEAKIIEWLEHAFGAETLEAQKKALDGQIEAQINPAVVSFSVAETGKLRANDEAYARKRANQNLK